MKTRIFLVLVFSAFSLWGCGGGGGDDSQSNPTQPFVFVMEGESSPGVIVMSRSNASGSKTALVKDSISWQFAVPQASLYSLTVRYSNDNYGPLETVAIQMGTDQKMMTIGSFEAKDTGEGGLGWNVFLESNAVEANLGIGNYTLLLKISGGDGSGVEIDKITFTPVPAD